MSRDDNDDDTWDALTNWKQIERDRPAAAADSVCMYIHVVDGNL